MVGRIHLSSACRRPKTVAGLTGLRRRVDSDAIHFSACWQTLEEQTKSRYVCSYEVATAYVLLGKEDQAFRWFDKVVEDRSDCMVMLVVDPRLDSIRSDTRFPSLVRRVGMWQ